MCAKPVEQLEWRVQLTIIGTITDNWNSVADGGEVSFVGAGWNCSIGPGEEAQVGYCVTTGM